MPELDIKRAPSVDEPGLSLDPLRINQGGNSGHQALNLAVLFGCNPIVLVGFDMRLGPGGEKHFYPDHREGLSNPDHMACMRWAVRFRLTVPDLKRAGVTVLNASRRTALDCFPRVTLDEALT